MEAQAYTKATAIAVLLCGVEIENDAGGPVEQLGSFFSLRGFILTLVMDNQRSN